MGSKNTVGSKKAIAFTPLLAIGVTLAVALGCQSESVLPREVGSLCGSMALQLSEAAQAFDTYYTRVTTLSLTPDQATRAEMLLRPVAFGGMSDAARAGSSSWLLSTVSFCIRVHHADKSQLGDLDSRLAVMVQTYRESQDLKTVSKTVADMATLIKEVNALPLEK